MKNTRFLTGLGGYSATYVCNRIPWLATSTFATRFSCWACLRQSFATKACNNRPRQRVCNRGGGGARQNGVLIYSHIYIYIYICIYVYIYICIYTYIFPSVLEHGVYVDFMMVLGNSVFYLLKGTIRLWLRRGFSKEERLPGLKQSWHLKAREI